MVERSKHPIDSRSVTEIITSLGNLLQNSDTIAYVLGLPSMKEITASVAADDQLIQKKLRVTEKLASTVKDDERPWVSGNWLICCNPRLEERAPADLIQDLEGSEQDMSILHTLDGAAEAFVAAA